MNDTLLEPRHVFQIEFAHTKVSYISVPVLTPKTGKWGSPAGSLSFFLLPPGPATETWSKVGILSSAAPEQQSDGGGERENRYSQKRVCISLKRKNLKAQENNIISFQVKEKILLQVSV